MSRQIYDCEFEANVKGEQRILKGTGAGSFEASRDAIIKVMRSEKVSFNHIEITKVLSENPTGEWV